MNTCPTCGQRIAHAPKPPLDNRARDDSIFRARWGGRTYADIGREYGLSGGRIKEIYDKHVRMTIVRGLGPGRLVCTLNRKHYPGESPEEWVARVKRELAFEDSCAAVIAAQEEVAAIAAHRT